MDLIKKGFFSSENGNYKGNVAFPLSHLDASATQRLHDTLNKLGITDALISTLKELEELGVDPSNAIRIVGSSVFWILGKEYFIQRFDDIKINLYDYFTDDQLNELFKQPADIDLRIDLRILSAARRKSGILVNINELNNILVARNNVLDR